MFRRFNRRQREGVASAQESDSEADTETESKVHSSSEDDEIGVLPAQRKPRRPSSRSAAPRNEEEGPTPPASEKPHRLSITENDSVKRLQGLEEGRDRLLSPPTPPTSKYEKQFRLFIVLSVAQAAVWILGIEMICLYQGACYARLHQAVQMNKFVTVSPASPPGAATTAVASAFVFQFIVLPVGIYVLRTEHKQSARMYSVASGLFASLLIVFSCLYFVQGKKASKFDWQDNAIAQDYYGGDEAEANSAWKKANLSFAILFLVNGIFEMLTCVVAAVLSRAFPERISRPKLLPITSRARKEVFESRLEPLAVDSDKRDSKGHKKRRKRRDKAPSSRDRRREKRGHVDDAKGDNLDETKPFIPVESDDDDL